jgi:Transposase DDE domain
MFIDETHHHQSTAVAAKKRVHLPDLLDMPQSKCPWGTLTPGQEWDFVRAEVAYDNYLIIFRFHFLRLVLYSRGDWRHTSPSPIFAKEIPALPAQNCTKNRREKNRQECWGGQMITTADFTFPEDFSSCVCPAGQRLYRCGYQVTVNNSKAIKIKSPKSARLPCRLRARCLRKPKITEIRQVAYFTGKSSTGEQRFTEKMKQKIDSVAVRAINGIRLAVGEPPFAHIQSALGLNRFTLHGKKKVNTQGNLFCIVHSLKKICNFGTEFA